MVAFVASFLCGKRGPKWPRFKVIVQGAEELLTDLPFLTSLTASRKRICCLVSKAPGCVTRLLTSATASNISRSRVNMANRCSSWNTWSRRQPRPLAMRSCERALSPTLPSIGVAWSAVETRQSDHPQALHRGASYGPTARYASTSLARRSRNRTCESQIDQIAKCTIEPEVGGEPAANGSSEVTHSGVIRPELQTPESRRR